MAGMTGGSSMLRTRRKDHNVKPNRKLDRKSSRGVLYENEELRLRTININAEIDQGQSDIKKLKRENEQLKREILILRNEYDKLEQLLKNRPLSDDEEGSHSSCSSGCHSTCDCCCENHPEDENHYQIPGNTTGRRGSNVSNGTKQLTVVPEEEASRKSSILCDCSECIKKPQQNLAIMEAPCKSADIVIHEAPGPTFHNGGNLEDLLGAVGGSPNMNSYLQKNYIMCNTKRSVQNTVEAPKVYETPNSFITERSIEVNYDYPKPRVQEETRTEMDQTVVWVQQKVPLPAKSKWGFLFRSRSVPVGNNEEPIYATVKKLPRALKRMDIAALEKEASMQPIQEEKSELKPVNDRVENSPDTDGSVKTVIERKEPFKLSTDSPEPRKKIFSWRFRRRKSKETLSNANSPKSISPENTHTITNGGCASVCKVVNSNGHSVSECKRDAKSCRHNARRVCRHSSSCSTPPTRRRSVSYQVLTAIRLLSVGSYQRAVGQEYHLVLGQTTVSKVLKLFLTKFLAKFYQKYIVFPTSAGSRKAVVDGFYNKYRFPNVLGCIDCTHVAIATPHENPESFKCHHDFYSLNVQLICDVNGKILNVYARYPGRTHDQFIFNNSSVKEEMIRLYENRIGDYHLIGDSGYALEPWMMTPIVPTLQGTAEERYTQLLCQLRNVIERVNGILKAIFRSIKRERVLHYQPIVANKIVNACCTLYNMMLTYRVPLPEPDLNAVDLVNNYQQENGRLLNIGRNKRDRLIQEMFAL